MLKRKNFTIDIILNKFEFEFVRAHNRLLAAITRTFKVCLITFNHHIIADLLY